jgi:hypothetical protein
LKTYEISVEFCPCISSRDGESFSCARRQRFLYICDAPDWEPKKRSLLCLVRWNVYHIAPFGAANLLWKNLYRTWGDVVRDGQRIATSHGSLVNTLKNLVFLFSSVEFPLNLINRFIVGQVYKTRQKYFKICKFAGKLCDCKQMWCQPSLSGLSHNFGNWHLIYN